MQFHPEKSGEVGLELIKDMFINWNRLEQGEIKYNFKTAYNPKMLNVVNNLYSQDVALLNYSFKKSSVNIINDVPPEIQKMSMIDKPKDLKIEDNKSKYDKYRKKDDKKDDKKDKDKCC